MDVPPYPGIVDGLAFYREMASFLIESVAWWRAVACNLVKLILIGWEKLTVAGLCVYGRHDNRLTPDVTDGALARGAVAP